MTKQVTALSCVTAIVLLVDTFAVLILLNFNFNEAAFIQECQSVNWEEVVNTFSDVNDMFDSLHQTVLTYRSSCSNQENSEKRTET